MSLAQYIKKYGAEALGSAKAMGGKVAAHIPENVKSNAKALGENYMEFNRDHPVGSALAGFGALHLGEGAIHGLTGRNAAGEDEDSPGHKVDALLRKLGVG